ncbi:MAG TPA: NAD(P)/FAD-dependent oxidoreductase [Nocardioidaceae bacterium]|nr:NAD(P)/FAD-dependent oxidoreductase [Nocardioidaceae bacterium]
MSTTDTVVIGAGHAGLAVSHCLTAAGRDHVVLDRGRVAERWRTERWDSLHLLTPSWMTRLPGWRYDGPDPDGYLAVGELIAYLESYAKSFDAPVQSGTTVLSVTERSGGYRVETDQGTWTTRRVVVATGPWGKPAVPEGLDIAGSGLHLTSASSYRNPSSLPDGGVLVVGASASGVQIADELARSGRPVVIAVGRHTRMPRRYRGMDIFWWLERTGRLARTIDDVRDVAAARTEPSMQLVGRGGHAGCEKDIDLAALADRGIRVAGRLREITGGVAKFRDDLAARVAESDHRMHTFLDAVDSHIAATGLEPEVWDPLRPRPYRPGSTPSRLDLRAEGITTVLLATGYRPHHPWLHVPVTAPDGTIHQHRGITPAPGLYVVGQRFQHRRDSGFIDGARHDATTVVDHITSPRTLQKTPR